MDNSRCYAPRSRDAFLAEILDEYNPASTAAFVAEILYEYDPDEPRDERGRWTTGGSHGGSPTAIIAPGDPGTSRPSGLSYDEWLYAIKYGVPGTSPGNSGVSLTKDPIGSAAGDANNDRDSENPTNATAPKWPKIGAEQLGDLTKGFPRLSIPRVDRHATLPKFVGKGMPKSRKQARKFLRDNVRRIKMTLVKQMAQMLEESPPKSIGPLTRDDITTIANAVADAYMSAVDEFLKSHWDVEPSKCRAIFGFLRPSASVCTEWGNRIFASLNASLSQEVVLSDGRTKKLGECVGIQTWSIDLGKGWVDRNFNGTGYQNFQTLAPAGYIFVAHKPFNQQSFSFLFLDPWWYILPVAYRPVGLYPYPFADHDASFF